MSAPLARALQGQTVWVTRIEDPGIEAGVTFTLVWESEDDAKTHVAQWLERVWDADILGAMPAEMGEAFEVFDCGSDENGYVGMGEEGYHQSVESQIVQ
jgi:hypothetical protein